MHNKLLNKNKEIENPFIENKYNFHMLKVSSLPLETRNYIERYPIGLSEITLERVIAERWFNDLSDSRIKSILSVFRGRYLKFIKPFLFLKMNISRLNANDWKWIILAHLILTDPLFRWFDCEFLPSISFGHAFTKDQVAREIKPKLPDHIRANTRITYSAKLIGALKAIQLLKGRVELQKEKLDFSAFGFYYVLFLLQSISFDLSFFHESYLFLSFFVNKDDLFDGYEILSSQNYISLEKYGEHPSIQLKKVKGLIYE